MNVVSTPTLTNIFILHLQNATVAGILAAHDIDYAESLLMPKMIKEAYLRSSRSAEDYGMLIRFLNNGCYILEPGFD